ncbi:50S ribosomal protein L18 [Candidatus Legionella polyplacis]|uniref:Large ribosomal subunit protein uL18 n=1 Tax=Candidatus Legionella polyplacis TaxID=2005262 RepID=A0ABZ2GW40_9GAMM|nr:50S ribosomal protein L18 [Candidatus Legionella polyplacis]ATW01751.1 50S ribosomal protein L18 [Candidatus Legionella polyplacis]
MICKNKIRKKRCLKSKYTILHNSNRPRIVVYRSSKNIYAQIIDYKNKGRSSFVVTYASSVDKEIKKNLVNKSKIEQSEQVGILLGKRAISKGIVYVAFDRSGYKYHGRIKSLANGIRISGLKF